MLLFLALHFFLNRDKKQYHKNQLLQTKNQVKIKVMLRSPSYLADPSVSEVKESSSFYMRGPLAADDDLNNRDDCLLESNYHPKWTGRGVVQREILCLLWTLMIQRKQTNDPPRVSRRVHQLHHFLPMETETRLFLFWNIRERCWIGKKKTK